MNLWALVGVHRHHPQNSEAVEPMKKMVVIEECVGESEIRIAKLRALFENKGKEILFPTEVHDQIIALQKEIELLLGAPKEMAENIENHKKVVVFGGLSNMTLWNAQKWLTDQLWSAWLPHSTETYCKGDFKGILFAKSKTDSERGEVVGWLKKSPTKSQNDDVWSKPDRPLNERVLQSLVFGTEWCVCKSLWADPEKGLVTLWGEKVLQGSITDGKLSIEYGEGWETYLHHKDYPEFKENGKYLECQIRKRRKRGRGKWREIQREVQRKFDGK